jgi:hypothetical protein
MQIRPSLIVKTKCVGERMQLVLDLAIAQADQPDQSLSTNREDAGQRD